MVTHSSLTVSGNHHEFSEQYIISYHIISYHFLEYVVQKGQLQPDPAKVKAVEDWPNFANFYRRFVRNYSHIAAPLTQLTSIKKLFEWTPATQAAFENLKTMFANAPVLIHPDPDLQFVVEVDASDSGMGPILSQRPPADQKLHLCAFFSHCLSPVERNFDIGKLRAQLKG